MFFVMNSILRRCSRFIKWCKFLKMRRLRKSLAITITMCIIVIIFVSIAKSPDKKRVNKNKTHRKIKKNTFEISRTNVTPLNLSKDKMKIIEARLLERKLQAKAHCPGNNVTNYRSINSKEFLINRQYHLIWCNVFKAASTSWFYNFNLMANYSAQYLEKSLDVPLHLARRRYPRPKTDELLRAKNDSISFMIVRHPFERLASAFISKFLHRSAENTKYERMGQMIIDLYRNNYTKPDGFSEDLPTFVEFVIYLLWLHKNRNELDIHWIPYTQFCTPCQYDFDYILKMETLQEEQLFLMEKANLLDVIKPVHLNYDYEKQQHYDSIYDMYSTLTQSQLEGLYEIYELDFLMFNYSRYEYDELLKYKLDDNVEFEIEPIIHPDFESIRQGHDWIVKNLMENKDIRREELDY